MGLAGLVGIALPSCEQPSGPRPDRSPTASTDPEPVLQTAIEASDVEPGPASAPRPQPPEDPWTAAGLDALRNGDDLSWPVEAVHVTSKFGWRVDPVTGSGVRLHRGVDFRGNVGDLVLSIAAGTVTFAGQDPALGTMVEVDHGLGISSLYGHLSDVLTHEGARVDRGAAVGLVGNTGRSAAAHLHLTTKIDDVAVDPLMLLGQPLHRATALRAVSAPTRELPATAAAVPDPPSSAAATPPAPPPVPQP